jgi:hypothetical protein
MGAISSGARNQRQYPPQRMSWTRQVGASQCKHHDGLARRDVTRRRQKRRPI